MRLSCLICYICQVLKTHKKWSLNCSLRLEIPGSYFHFCTHILRELEAAVDTDQNEDLCKKEAMWKMGRAAFISNLSWQGQTARNHREMVIYTHLLFTNFIISKRGKKIHFWRSLSKLGKNKCVFSCSEPVRWMVFKNIAGSSWRCIYGTLCHCFGEIQIDCESPVGSMVEQKAMGGNTESIRKYRHQSK